MWQVVGQMDFSLSLFKALPKLRGNCLEGIGMRLVFSSVFLMISLKSLSQTAAPQTEQPDENVSAEAEQEEPTSPPAEKVERIDVTGSRIQKTEVDQASKIEISREEAELVAPSGDVAQVPKLFPGTLARPGESEVSIRGSDADDSRYFIDDLEVPNLFEPLSGTSVVPSKAINNLVFYPGNFAAEYGNSTGGVIKLETRGGDIFEPYSEFRLNVPIYLSAYHEQELTDNSTVIVSGRKSTLEGFVSAFAEDGQVFLPYFQDAYLQHYYDGDSFTAKTRFIHSLSGAELKIFAERSTSTDGTTEFDFENGYNLFGTDIELGSGGLNLEIAPFISRSRTEFSVSDVFFNIEVTSLNIPVRKQFEVSRDFNIFSGFELVYQDVNLQALVPDRVSQGPFFDPENADKILLDIDESTRRQAVWSTFEYRWGNLLLAPSLRLFSQSSIPELSYDPRFIARYNYSPSQTLKMGIGQFTQSPRPEEISSEYGNEDLDWIRSIHYMVGLESNVLNNWTSDLQLYVKNWRDDVTEDALQRYLSSTTRQSKGLEWFFRYSNLGPWFGWLSYTYSETEEKRGPDAPTVPSDNDATHILNIVGNYKINDSWQIGGRLKHQTGYVFTPINEVWYQSNTDTYQPISDPNLVNSERVEDTTSASVFVQKDWKYESWKLVTRFGLEEYQFTKSSPNINYNYDYSERELTTGLPVIPYIELRAIL